MSLETDIAKLTDEVIALQQRYQAKPDVFDQWLAQFRSSFQSTIDDLNAGNIYVDQAAGDDANVGSGPNSPLASVDEAIRRIPELGIGDIQIRGEYRLTKSISIGYRQIGLNLYDGALEQVGGGTISMRGNGSLRARGGVIRTALYTNNGPGQSTSSALFRRDDSQATRVYTHQTRIELGDQALLGGGNYANPPHELSVDQASLTIRDGVTANPKIAIIHSGLAFLLLNLSVPSDKTWADLVDGNRSAIFSNRAL